jgi:hypothetical protein
MGRKKEKIKAQKQERLRRKGYLECYYCGELVPPKALRCPHCGKIYSSGKKVIAVAIALSLLLVATGIYYLSSTKTTPDSNTVNQGDTEKVYHLVGTGDSDFWITYPPAHPKSGQEVIHPYKVRTALQSKPVMILTHSENCQPCVVQTEICNRIYSKYASSITYMDLLSGVSEPDATETFNVYDPNDEMHYIPLLIVVTYVKDSKNHTAIGWHAWEGIVDEQILDGWIADAIAHYRKCT